MPLVEGGSFVVCVSVTPEGNQETQKSIFIPSQCLEMPENESAMKDVHFRNDALQKLKLSDGQGNKAWSFETTLGTFGNVAGSCGALAALIPRPVPFTRQAPTLMPMHALACV